VNHLIPWYFLYYLLLFSDLMSSTISHSDLLAKQDPSGMSIAICPSMLILILYSAPWAFRWKSWGHHLKFRVYNAQSGSNLSSILHVVGGVHVFQLPLWSWWSHPLAPAISSQLSLSWCHSKDAWRPWWPSLNHVVESDLWWLWALGSWGFGRTGVMVNTEI